MTRDKSRALFIRALTIAAERVERVLSKPIPRSFSIELHGAGSPGHRMEIHEALDRIYIGDDRFHRVIDVAIKEVLPDAAIAFVRVSDHPPAEFEKTWNPSELGPFKQIVSARIVDRRR